MTAFFGKEGTENRARAEAIRKEYPSYNALGLAMFFCHTHGNLCDKEEIVYREADVIKLLNALDYEVKFPEQ